MPNPDHRHPGPTATARARRPVCLGIDFGTTHTVVACADRGNYPLAGFLGPDGDVVEWFPSLVAERDHELCFGFDALARAGQPGWTVVGSFKRWLAAPDLGQESAVDVGALRLPLRDLLAAFLGALRGALVERSNLGRALRGAAALPVVVAVPANAHGVQRFITLDAFRRAGFEVRALVNEPTAAGFEYAHRFRATLSSRREHVVVYDLGGGTFDASLVRMTERHHDVVTTAGLSRLGGDDFDQVLARLVLDGAGLAPAALGPAQQRQLAERCREAKEALTPSSRRMAVELEGLGLAGAPTQVVVPVAAFYEACGPLVEATLAAMRPVVDRLPPGAAEEEAVDPLRDVAGIYVVGGGSALPLVGRSLRERYGRRVHRSPYPFAATAIGLAIVGDPDAGFALVDRFSRYLGVFREARHGHALAFDPILTPETPLPSPGVPLTLSREYRAAHNLGHYRFVECRALDDAGLPRGEVVPLGEVLFAFDPALRASEVELARTAVQRTPGPGVQVREDYRLDANGLVEVTLTDLDRGHARTLRLAG